jgi:hypothetical protein
MFSEFLQQFSFLEVLLLDNFLKEKKILGDDDWKTKCISQIIKNSPNLYHFQIKSIFKNFNKLKIVFLIWWTFKI